MKRASLLTIIASIVLVGSVTETGSLMFGRDAHAIVGRPLTPVSYAGVARRTARRTPYGYGAPVAGAAVAGAAVGAAAAATVATLPAGCVMAGGIYTCGAVRYQPVYSGATVVYQVI